MLLLAILATLLAIDPWLRSLPPVGFGASYALITWLSRRRLRRNSRRIAAEHTRVVKALQEGLGGIRDVLLDGTQPVYCDVYQRGRSSAAARAGQQCLHRAKPALRDGGARHGADRRAGLWSEPAAGRHCARRCRCSARSRSARSACCRRCSRRIAPGRRIAGSQRRAGGHARLLDQPHARGAAATARPRRCSSSARFASSTCASATRRWPLGPRRSQSRHRERRAGRLRRQHRQRQEHDPGPADGSADADRGPDPRRWAAVAAAAASAPGSERSRTCRRASISPMRRSRKTSPSACRAETIDMQRVRRGRATGADRRFHREPRRRATRRSSASAACACPAGSGSASASPARSTSEASVLVLDEATSALDNVDRTSVMDAIEGSIAGSHHLDDRASADHGAALRHHRASWRTGGRSRRAPTSNCCESARVSGSMAAGRRN